MSSFEAFWLRPRKWLLHITLLLLAVSVMVSAYAIDRQGNAVQQACQIQKRGLQANAHLIRFFEDWDRLIALQRKAEQKQLLKEPQNQRLVTNAAIAELDAFVVLQGHQPKHRTCP